MVLNVKEAHFIRLEFFNICKTRQEFEKYFRGFHSLIKICKLMKNRKRIDKKKRVALS